VEFINPVYSDWILFLDTNWFAMSLLNYSKSSLSVMEPKINLEPEVYHFKPYDAALKPFQNTFQIQTSQTSENHFTFFPAFQDLLPTSPEKLTETDEDTQNDEERSQESVPQNSFEIFFNFCRRRVE
jgi:hypothetical protein